EPRVRTDWERQLIAACDEWNRPILGVCYGEQLLNVHYGGTLYQDIATECNSDLDHGKSEQSVHHEVTFEQDFLGIQAGQKLPVAARHHQAIRDTAPGISVVARAADGGIEAIEGHGHYGVQWHAESDDTAPTIYGAFIQKCITQAHPKRVVHAQPKPKVLSRILTRFR
ncbi:MAG TPA: gamma-glutamyl-gamma-aminobutyrate hydrolase family protein, partial [Candidatus Saccharimonadales bacterium]|nr:gamma-glutamyl-gamma-aminobutyrate hydrolase family protein [Candidatus Saccharimonadales bacterium]